MTDGEPLRYGPPQPPRLGADPQRYAQVGPVRPAQHAAGRAPAPPQAPVTGVPTAAGTAETDTETTWLTETVQPTDTARPTGTAEADWPTEAARSVGNMTAAESAAADAPTTTMAAVVTATTAADAPTAETTAAETTAADTGAGDITAADITAADITAGDMTAADPTAAPSPEELADRVPRTAEPLAGFGARALSFAVDTVLPLALLGVLVVVGARAENILVSLALFWAGYLGVFSFVIWNSCHRQGSTGQSLGRRLARTRLVGAETGEPVGLVLALVRQACHMAEFGIGLLWPLWDERRQTFADKLVGTVVVRAAGREPAPEPERSGP